MLPVPSLATRHRPPLHQTGHAGKARWLRPAQGDSMGTQCQHGGHQGDRGTPCKRTVRTGCRVKMSRADKSRPAMRRRNKTGVDSVGSKVGRLGPQRHLAPTVTPDLRSALGGDPGQDVAGAAPSPPRPRTRTPPRVTPTTVLILPLSRNQTRLCSRLYKTRDECKVNILNKTDAQ